MIFTIFVVDELTPLVEMARSIFVPMSKLQDRTLINMIN